ncbi:ATPase [Sulfodiicoccus acidiphilus]|uniref:ATPase n=1 Tax=Sulfodiicoccus acidiphilus TaxID=1670455 RepID=A0A348B4W2_9CREN|nr:ATP-binding protein [Sulfodiicoccus acidiphilus]BBD73214.1 ATPase [Sulfodiicoccus acidiphilus]GGU04877.1 ATPase [Sulfodiicoccus acidiphilus]
MLNLRAVTEEYVGGLQFVNEIPREIKLNISSPDITVVAGPRRVGKTFLMLREVRALMGSGERVAYLSLDDPLFRGIDARRLAELVRSEYPEGRVYLFLDEVQDWKDWDFKLRWLHDVKDFKLVVSGSSSSLLSSEIPSRLRGRQFTKVVLPISIRELVPSAGGDFRERGVFNNILREYLVWGGFPEPWIYRSREKLIDVVETVFYRDLVERNRIRDTEQFRAVFDFLLSNYSNQMTWNSVRNMLKGIGVDVDVKTVMNYVDYMRKAFLVFPVRRYDYSERRRAVSPKKLYLVDLGIASLYENHSSARSQGNLGRKLENLIFLELIRRSWEVDYYLLKDGREVDFVARKEGKKLLVEVTLNTDTEHVDKVRRAMLETGIREAHIVSLEGETKILGDGMKEVQLLDWISGSGLQDR